MAIQDILFIDIETLPVENKLPVIIKEGGEVVLSEKAEFFAKKFANDWNLLHIRESTWDQFWLDRASLMAEFGKIVSISMGKINSTNKLYIKTTASKDEVVCLKSFLDIVQVSSPKILCAHNGKEFDFPYLMRRLIINSLAIPEILNSFGKKPWELAFEDTMQMWGGTAWNYKISLDLLCYTLGLESPKKEFQAKNVAEVYFGMLNVKSDELVFDKEETALRQIGKYNAGDVVSLVNCYLRMKNLPIIEPDKIEYK